MSAVFQDGLTLFGVRRMMEGVIPPTLCTASVDHMPNVSYLSLAEYIDPLHIALSYQFFNRSRENVLATKRAGSTMVRSAAIAAVMRRNSWDPSGS